MDMQFEEFHLFPPSSHLTNKNGALLYIVLPFCNGFSFITSLDPHKNSRK